MISLKLRSRQMMHLRQIPVDLLLLNLLLRTAQRRQTHPVVVLDRIRLHLIPYPLYRAVIILHPFPGQQLVLARRNVTADFVHFDFDLFEQGRGLQGLFLPGDKGMLDAVSVAFQVNFLAQEGRRRVGQRVIFVSARAVGESVRRRGVYREVAQRDTRSVWNGSYG